jgi:ribose transport system substrate-binding protein
MKTSQRLKPLVVAAFSLLLVACQTGTSGSPTVSSSASTPAGAAPTPLPAADLTIPSIKPSKRYTIGLVIGVVGDPFYVSMSNAAQAEADKLGIDIIIQGPQEYRPVLETPIVDAMISRKVDFLLVVPTDAQAMIAPLRRAYDAGIPVITLDTFIGNANYGSSAPEGFVTAYIGSDNFEGGMISCEALIKDMGDKGKLLIENTIPGDSSNDGRENGCKAAIDNHPDVALAGVNYDDNDPNKAQALTAAVLQRTPDLGGIFGTNFVAAGGSGKAVANAGLTGVIKVAAFDATAVAIEDLRNKISDIVIAQKPWLMAQLGLQFAVNYLEGNTDLPRNVSTGFGIITRDNVDDPATKDLIY